MNAPTKTEALAADKPAARSRLPLAAVIAVAVLAACAAPAVLETASGVESTEDAYVDGNVVLVTPQVAGTVTRIAADNTDYVRAGQPLVQLNEVDARLALARAEAQLARTARQVRAQFANATQAGAGLEQRAADLARAEADLGRRRQLADSGAVAGEEIRHAEDAVRAARAAWNAARQQVAASQALVEGTRVDTHPDVLAAIAQLRDAWVAVGRTTLSAPVGGYVARRNVQLGQRVAPGASLMAVVPLDQVWVNANFKESQLRHVRIGQRAVLHADVYGKDVTYTGRVVGQDAGTGSAFAALPAQNASGNWIKVVQRVPVRIALDPVELQRHPLRLGLSMKVELDARGQNAAGRADAPRAPQQYRTDVFAAEADDPAADRLVQRILHGEPATLGMN